MNSVLATFCAVVIMLSVYLGIGLAVVAVFRKLNNKGYIVLDMLLLGDCNDVDVSDLALMAMFWPILVVAVIFISAVLLILLPFYIIYLLFLKAAKAVFK